MSDTLNPVLLDLAVKRVWGTEKQAFQPPGPPPTDPAMGGAPPPGGMAPPMDPAAMAGGMAPPMDPTAMAGGMAPPMDPSMGAAGGMAPPPMDPTMGGMGGAAGAGQKIKPEQWMQQLDYRIYNFQQQLTALLNKLGVEIPSGALIMPPGVPMAPQPEQAQPGGAMDPAQQAGPEAGGGASAISPIDPMQGASPELAQGGKMAAWQKTVSYTKLPPAVEEFKKDAQANVPEGWDVIMVKASATGEGYRGSVDEEKPPTVSSPPQPLAGPHPGKTPSLSGPPTAGGSVDPKSRTEADDEMGPANASEKSSAQAFAANMADDPPRADSFIGDPVARDLVVPVTTGAAAVAALYRSKTAQSA